MNEAEISRKIIKRTQELLPGCVIFKHNERTRGGVPDISVTYGGRTTWIEVKYIRPNESQSRMRSHFDKLQLHEAKNLSRQGRCLYFIAYHSVATANLCLYASKVEPHELEDLLNMEIFSPTNFTTTDLLKPAIDQLIQRCLAFR